MKRRPKIKTEFIIWEKENHNSVPRDAEVRRWIYHNGAIVTGKQIGRASCRERREREQYYTKLSRSMKRKENEFDRDIEQFKKYLEFEKMLR